MSNVVKKCLTLSLSIVGSIVGVGFITGKEIVTFFADFGLFAIPLCLIVAFLFGVFIYIISRFNINQVKNNHTNKKCENKDKKLKYDNKSVKLRSNNALFTIFDYILVICQISICSAMFAGFDTVLRFCDISDNVIIIVKVVLALWLVVYLLKLKNRIYIFNSVLSFIMIAVIAIVFFINLKTANISLFSEKISIKIAIYPILYVGMNLLTAYPLIENIGQNFRTKKECLLLSIFTSIFIFICLLFVSLCIVMFGGNFADSDMIMLSIAGQKFSALEFVYLIVIFIGIISTLFSTAYGGFEVLSKFLSPDKSLIIVVFVSFVLSFVGFSKIIDILYPTLGALCIVVILMKISMQKKCRNMI